MRLIIKLAMILMPLMIISVRNYSMMHIPVEQIISPHLKVQLERKVLQMEQKVMVITTTELLYS